MNKLKKIARMIEKELGFTNGWKIDNEKYTAKCHILAGKIVSQIEPLVMQLPGEDELQKAMKTKLKYNREEEKLINACAQIAWLEIKKRQSA